MTEYNQQSLSVNSASISPNLNHIAVVGVNGALNIYDMSTGKHLVDAHSMGSTVQFTPDGHEIWCPDSSEGWAIIGNTKSNDTKLEQLDPAKGPSGVLPWQPSCGFQVTDDGWVLSSTGKKLLWLPPHWRSHEKHRAWGGRFLALLHYGLPEVVIMELLEE